MPKIIHMVKYLYDHYKVKFFLTGSSSFYLKNLFPESLAGRKFVFELFPLTFEEFLVFKKRTKKFYDSFTHKDLYKNFVSYEKNKKLYDEYLEYGGFPEVVLEDNLEQKNMLLGDIFKSYFEKDVKNLTDFKQITVFRDLILLLMQRVASKVKISKIASELGISRDTVYSYLSFLQGSYFISLISPFSRNVDREVSGTKKAYFCDTGLVNRFARISQGGIFENAVFNNLKKYGSIAYYQKRSGAEIDFILEKKLAFEVKNKGTIAELQRLQKISRSLKIKKGYLITKEFSQNKGFIPAIEI